MATPRRYRELKALVERLHTDVSRAEGAKTQVMRQLKSDFQCKTLKAAEALAARMAKDIERLESEYDQELKRFERKYGRLLEEED